MSLAGNIAFRAVLALFPFLIFASSLTAFFGDPGMADRLVAFLIAIVPAPLVDTLVTEVRAVLTEKRGGVASIGVLLTIWFAAGGVDSVRVGLNRAYDIKEERSVWTIFVLQVLVVIGGALVFVVVAYLLVLVPIAGSLAHRLLPGFEPALVTLDVVRYPSVAAITMAALFAAHIFLPARWIRIFEHVARGGLHSHCVVSAGWRVFALSCQFRQLCELLCRSRRRDRRIVFLPHSSSSSAAK